MIPTSPCSQNHPLLSSLSSSNPKSGVTLTPTHENVQKLNDIIINHFPGEDHNLLSFDEQEYLNSITPSGLPPHVEKVKNGAPLMLLRNIDPKVGLCNGTRLLCRGTYMNMFDVEVLSGQHAGHRAFFA
ncbi:hypothetical protein Lal_00033717 [Lupinus albus]|nr:hypothetical protein Lal_00033717 [Lupinus albus]